LPCQLPHVPSDHRPRDTERQYSRCEQGMRETTTGTHGVMTQDDDRCCCCWTQGLLHRRSTTGGSRFQIPQMARRPKHAWTVDASSAPCMLALAVGWYFYLYSTARRRRLKSWTRARGMQSNATAMPGPSGRSVGAVARSPAALYSSLSIGLHPLATRD
jgi:hypothetical protein